MNTIPLRNKIFFIVHGLDVLGLALTELVLHREGKVFLSDRKSSEEALQILSYLLPEKSLHYNEINVGCPLSFEEAFQSCATTFGNPDIVINLTNIFGEDSWETMIDVNLKSMIRGIELSFKYMRSGGVLVNLTSPEGVSCHGSMVAIPAFTAVKHAITALTRTYGHEMYFNRTGVRVIAIAPSYISGSELVESHFTNFTSNTEAIDLLQSEAQKLTFMKPSEAALKVINVLNSNNGSVWFLRSTQLRPINIPSPRLPH